MQIVIIEDTTEKTIKAVMFDSFEAGIFFKNAVAKEIGFDLDASNTGSAFIGDLPISFEKFEALAVGIRFVEIKEGKNEN